MAKATTTKVTILELTEKEAYTIKRITYLLLENTKVNSDNINLKKDEEMLELLDIAKTINNTL